MKRAITTHLSDFVAIIVLLVLSIVVAGYVLNHERLRFPFIQSAPFTLNAEFNTAQAVTPGQGQTVRISGVQVGDIGGVSLKNGIAIVKMDIDQKYKNVVHQDWSALLRPKTGLKDMFIELSPPVGGSHTPVAKPGYTIPVSNTMPDINPDEVLSSLDSDTREYLDLLVNGAGQGLKNNGGNELAGVFKRFEPTHQDLARLNKVVAERGAALRRLINSLQILNTALAQKQGQIVQLVDASAIVFRAFAAENQNVSRAVADLPGTLQQTTSTLQRVTAFANILGPTTANLIPAVSAIPAANQAVTQLAIPATPVLKSQVRPFVVAARPVVRNLRPAAVNLAAATPNLAKVFTVLNHLFNLLGYSPGAGQHGYLWWLAWLNHDARTLFSQQDANGDFRPLFLQASCASYDQIVSQSGPLAGLLLNVAPILGNAGLCPKGHPAADVKTYNRSMARHGMTPAGTPAKSSQPPSSGGPLSNVTSTARNAIGALSHGIASTVDKAGLPAHAAGDASKQGKAN